jgi:hypothetical protein
MAVAIAMAHAVRVLAEEAGGRGQRELVLSAAVGCVGANVAAACDAAPPLLVDTARVHRDAGRWVAGALSVSAVASEGRSAQVERGEQST